MSKRWEVRRPLSFMSTPAAVPGVYRCPHDEAASHCARPTGVTFLILWRIHHPLGVVVGSRNL
ncbi:MAG: hypothetical protein M5U01_14060 [Ardenticatenaceae bacterium]|nr:hypothetical protein [Ardenticatenaceae bacterium]